MRISFENQVALVTGAASGLGLATAAAFAQAGASVVLADWNEDAVRVAAESLASQGHRTLAVHCDVADDAQVEAMVQETVATFGRLDAAFNNAGVHAAKHGVHGLTKSAALEYATRGIRVNAVCPGLIQTPMADKLVAEGQGPELEAMLKNFVPMGRMGRPEEIADAVLWLCSSAASYVTGQSISVDGGFVMR